MAAVEAGSMTRYEEPSRPLSAAIAIVVLTGLEMVFVLLLFVSLFRGWITPEDQILQSQWLFAIFMIFGFILMIYRRYFMADILVVKVRNKKYEDFIDPNRIPRGLE